MYSCVFVCACAATEKCNKQRAVMCQRRVITASSSFHSGLKLFWRCSFDGSSGLQGFLVLFCFFLLMSELRLIWKHHLPKHDDLPESHTITLFIYFLCVCAVFRNPNLITRCTFFLPLSVADVQSPPVQSWTKLWICRLAHWSPLVGMCEQPVCLEISINRFVPPNTAGVSLFISSPFALTIFILLYPLTLTYRSSV